MTVCFCQLIEVDQEVESTVNVRNVCFGVFILNLFGFSRLMCWNTMTRL